VLDNLNTHGPDSLYRTLEPAKAKRLADRLEIHYTPKHGSWLTMAEIELSMLARQCLAERMNDKATLQTQVKAWQECCNSAAVKIDWRFTTVDARIKLKKLYSTILHEGWQIKVFFPHQAITGGRDFVYNIER
jgi:hypothetical protein